LHTHKIKRSGYSDRISAPLLREEPSVRKAIIMHHHEIP